MLIDTTWLSQLLLKAIRRTTEHARFRKSIKFLLPIMAGLPAVASFSNWAEFEGLGKVNIFRSVQLGIGWWSLLIPIVSVVAVLLIFVLPRFRGRYAITAYFFVIVPTLAIASIWDVPRTLIGYFGIEVSFLIGSLFIVLALFIDYYEPPAPLEDSFARFSHRGRYQHLLALKRLATTRGWEFQNSLQDYQIVNVYGEMSHRQFHIQSSREIDPPLMVLVITIFGLQSFPSVTILGGSITMPSAFRNIPVWGKVRNSRNLLVPLYWTGETRELPNSYFNSIKNILEVNRVLFDSRSRLDVRDNTISYQMTRSLEMNAQDKQIDQILEMLLQLTYLLERVPIA